MDGVEDAFRRPVPERLREIFVGRKEMVEWCVELEGLEAQAARFAMEPYGQEMSFETIRSHLRAAKALMRLATPLEECDCPLAERDCPKCKGQRWVTGAGSCA